jgi:GxxExxY protein
MGTVVIPPNLNDLTSLIIACAIAVHRALGPGLLESTYRECLLIELRLAGLKVVCEQQVPIIYRGQRVSTSLRLDLIVEDTVILELKAVDKVHPVYLAQLLTYLKLTDRPAGLLLNFNMTSLRQGLHRVDHPQVRAQLKSLAEPEATNERPRVSLHSACPELGDR